MDLEQFKSSLCLLHTHQISSLQASVHNLSQSHDDLLAEFLDLRQDRSRCDNATKLAQNMSNVGEEPSAISVPQLKFIKATFPHGVVIEANGTVVRDRPEKPTQFNNVGTDALLLNGSHYWEVEVTWQPTSGLPVRGWRDVYSIGIRQEGSPFGYKLSWYSHSWTLGVTYNSQEEVFLHGFGHGNAWRYGGKINAPKEKAITHRFGFFLRPAGRTLTVVKSPSNKHLHTFANINSTRPLVPVVGLESPFFDRRFHLPRVDPSAVSPPIMEEDTIYAVLSEP